MGNNLSLSDNCFASNCVCRDSYCAEGPDAATQWQWKHLDNYTANP